MTYPNALVLPPSAWRQQKAEAPLGGLGPMGVHAIDGMIQIAGEFDQVFCQSFARVIETGPDDTTSMLFRMKNGASGYLGTMTATGAGFSFQVFGSKGWHRLEGVTHVAGAPSEERRTRQFGVCKFQPVKGPLETWEAERLDIVRATFEAFARAAEGGPPFPIPPEQIIHGASVSEAVIRSAASGKVEKVSNKREKHMDLGNGLGHLTYSTLVHPGDTWEDMWTSLTTYVPQVQKRVCPTAPFGVSLRLSNASATTLVKSKPERDKLKSFLADTICISTPSTRFPRAVQEPDRQGAGL